MSTSNQNHARTSLFIIFFCRPRILQNSSRSSGWHFRKLGRSLTHYASSKNTNIAPKRYKKKTDQDVDTLRNLFGNPQTHLARRKMQKISEKIKNPTKWLTLEEIRHQDPRIHTAPEKKISSYSA